MIRVLDVLHDSTDHNPLAIRDRIDILRSRRRDSDSDQ